MGIKHVHVNTTSLNGCEVEVDGDVVYTLIPLRFVGFHGSVHISGGSGCPNGDLYFGIEPKGKVAPTVPTNVNLE
jgi:hypothetical protein